MSSKKRKAAPASKRSLSLTKKACACGDDCHDQHANLPGYLLIAFGLLGLPFNFDLFSGFGAVKAWPLLLVLVGAVFVVKVYLCRIRN